MLSFDDLTFREDRKTLYGRTVLSSGVKAIATQVVEDRDSMACPRARMLAMAKQAIRVRLWQICYGELEPLLIELESEVHHEITAGGPYRYLDGLRKWEEIEPLFRRLRELVAPPKPPQS